ncbi:hypothetical protein LINGRAHAP2_LOCUS30184 [Linum grandiflorum]
MAPKRRNQEGDLPQTYVEEEHVVGADVGHSGGRSSNLAGEVALPQSVPSVDLGRSVQPNGGGEPKDDAGEPPPDNGGEPKDDVRDPPSDNGERPTTKSSFGIFS